MASGDHGRVLLLILHPVGGIRSYIRYVYGREWFDDYSFTIIEPDVGGGDTYTENFARRNFEYITCNGVGDMLGKLWSYTGKNEVALIHSHGFTAGCVVLPVALGRRIPHLMTGHDMFQQKQFAGTRGWLRRNVLSMVLKRIDRIHTVSNDATENMLEYFPGVRREKLVCIPHGIDAERFFSSAVSDLGLDADRSKTGIIGFFGRFMSPKGFRYLVDAIEIIKHRGLAKRVPLVLTFDWGGYVREEYEYLERKGLGEQFRMMQFTNNMPGVIKAMDMVIMPSVWESSGLLAMESLVAGVPIIGTSCTGLREVLRDSPATMVRPMDSEKLAIAIADEINHPRVNQFREYAVVARERFSLEKPSSKLKQLYDVMTNTGLKVG
ncbi:MAG: glycosyltransferase family 4 protein [Pseudomonadota bacterium]